MNIDKLKDIAKATSENGHGYVNAEDVLRCAMLVTLLLM